MIVSATVNFDLSLSRTAKCVICNYVFFLDYSERSFVTRSNPAAI